MNKGKFLFSCHETEYAKKIPFIFDSGHSGKKLTDDQKFVSLQRLNRIQSQKHVLNII